MFGAYYSRYGLATVLLHRLGYPITLAQAEVDDRNLFFYCDLRVFARAGHKQGAPYPKWLVRERADLPDLVPHLACAVWS